MYIAKIEDKVFSVQDAFVPKETSKSFPFGKIVKDLFVRLKFKDEGYKEVKLLFRSSNLNQFNSMFNKLKEKFEDAGLIELEITEEMTNEDMMNTVNKLVNDINSLRKEVTEYKNIIFDKNVASIDLVYTQDNVGVLSK